jgi:nucleoside-diphosphate-sugar epimerase
VAVAFVGAIGNEKAMGRGYHVAGEELMTWQQYHERIAEAMGYPKPRFIYIPTDALVRMIPEQAALLCKYNFTYNNIYDNTAAHEDLGFQVTIRWVDGVRRTIEWLDQNGLLLPAEEFPLYDRVIESWQKATATLSV